MNPLYAVIAILGLGLLIETIALVCLLIPVDPSKDL